MSNLKIVSIIVLVSTLLTFLVWLVSLSLDVYLLPDQGTSWYYWKLAEPNLITRLSAWIPYVLHQTLFWYLIYKSQKQGTKYTNGLHKINKQAIALNVAFVFIHLVQTYFFYDGLAQDVSVFSSQGSVILMLVWTIFMLNNERGVFFGKRLPFKQYVVEFAKKYHGYIFAWATVYTFWYHPTEGTFGHLVGFFYMFMLFAQGSLFFTKIHVNRYWRTFLEIFVLFHAVLVAIYQGGGIWPMFLFGFWGAFILIYMWGLRFSKVVLAVNITIYILFWLLIWGIVGYQKAYQTTFIPVIYYIAILLLFLILYIPAKIWWGRRG